ncbi:uncharacterized protein LOC120457848 isoform X2 [Drosophila santomea]|uniref:uncharacterized protein LOC120457848 isoform X2 n=1 Tax=Drosophila santomea TaxID=129105 RepID=UPI001954B19C|nr:uncharacterized protein LOC120457848 isoform X2 [Drosophila santomea]
MQHSPRKSARLNRGEATPITTVSQQPASSGAETRTRVNITAASIPCPATTVTTVASQPRSTAVTAASSVLEVNQPLALELMERIAALERELEKARSLESVSTANCAPIAVGANSGASGRPPFWSDQPIPTSNGEALHNGVGSVPYNGDGASGAACTLPPSSSGPPLLTTSNYFVEPLCATGIAQPAHGLVLPSVSIHNATTALVGSYAATTPSGIQGAYGPRKLPDLPIFGGQPEEWPIFSCAFVETTRAYNCTDLENNQRLLKALKNEAREAVKALLIHPGNVSAVMEQLGFRFGRPEQLIRSQLNNVREVQPISEHNLAKIIPFATRVSNLAAFLQSAKAEQHLGNPTLMEELVAKLPMSKRVDWARHAATIAPFPTVVHFSAWLQEYANVVCTVLDVEGKEPRRRLLHASVNHNECDQQNDRHGGCPICGGQHGILNCREFIGASPQERWSNVKRHRLCFKCLRSGHTARSCYTQGECQINGCRREHHRLLHGADEERRPLQQGGFRRHEGNQQPAVSRRSPARDQERNQQPAVSRRSPARDQERNRQPAAPSNSLERGAPREAGTPMQRNLSCVDAEGGRLLFRILPVTLYGAGREVDTYALLDEGSSVTMIDDELRKDLGVQGERRQLNIQWFGGKATREPTNVVSLKISGVGKPTRHVLKNVYAVSNLSLPMQTLSRRDVQGVHRDARLPMKPYSNVAPKLLIGLDHGHLGLPFRTRRFAREGPYAAATELGWVVFGPVSGQPTTPSPRSCLLAVSVDDAMEKMVEDYFDMENFGVKHAPPVAASDDVRAQRILEDTTVKVGRRYQTGLLWKDDHVVLPQSYEMAYRRLVNVEKKMKRNKPLAQEYDRIIKDYVSKGYARRLQPEEVAVRSDRLWYLPHFGVENPNKPGKVRLVFDAAAKVGGTSLNSELDKGPQHYKPLPAVLFHFREGAVGVCGDIKEMFHQVLIRPEDRCSQRFLWRDGDDERDPDVYEMNVMTFGAACSPSAAHYVKTMNALKYRDSDPRAVKAITDYHYVDDYVDSFATESEAISVSTRVKEIHKDAGFELCKFSSSSPTVETALGPGRVKSVGWGEAEEKILGMRWQVATDDFRFNVEYHRVPSSVLSGDRVPTKREYLSLVMSTFDPLGFLCCLMVTAKLLLREIWRQKIQWDEPLPEELSKAFAIWRKKMDTVGQFRCPRHYFGRGAVRAVELHVFVDASQAAFAAVAYWRVTYEDDDVQVSFVSAKTKCAPMRTMTIPRLELQAAVLGTRLMNTVKEEHSVVITDLVLWTDSKTVLRWIGSTHRRYKQFVGNRVAEILESSKVSQWRWVPTADNAADDATRSQKGVDLSQESRWLRGPAFLRQPGASWPGPEEGTERVPDAPDEEEMPCEFALVAADDFVIPFQRFSSFSRLVRTTAWVLRFARWCRKQRNELEEYGLTAAECKAAENLLVRQAQLESFPDEMRSAETGQDVARSSDIRGLVPYLDEDGILRAYGRIDAALCIPYSARRPVLLSHRHSLTDLIVRDFHARMKHQNVDATIAEIRTKFWVTKMRRMMRRVISSCNECKLQRARPMPPIMGPHPEDRLDAGGWPFKYTGLDYFGPLLVTVSRHKEKRWVALFTCLTTRAIHLELAHDLSTDSCIIAIRNFVCRRGPVYRLRSDNGKNFVGADREARRFGDVFEMEKLQSELSSRSIEWVFNCPANPSEGGVWERMVQCVKRVLRHTLKEVAPRDHVLESFLIEAENIVNSRPLTHLPVDADQEAPLTPNDLLKGVANLPDTPGLDAELPKEGSTRKQWRIARLLRDRFWRRWVMEYLPTLVRREKWCRRTEPIHQGDMVFVCDPALARREWRKGIVEEIYSGADGVVRRAKVRVNDNGLSRTMMRPVSKLAVLDLSEAVLHGVGDVADL